jgi:hypothetical protein
MQLPKVIWVFWLAGVALIFASWARVVSPDMGWLGFAVAGIAAFISWIPVRPDPARLPLTQEGLPVQPSGAPVPADMVLHPGSPVLAQSQGRWWRATVMRIEENGDAVLRFPGWDAKRVERIPRRLLQVDPDPSRRPLVLPTEPLTRWNEESRPEGYKASDPNTRP